MDPPHRQRAGHAQALWLSRWRIRTGGQPFRVSGNSGTKSRTGSSSPKAPLSVKAWHHRCRGDDLRHREPEVRRVRARRRVSRDVGKTGVRPACESSLAHHEGSDAGHRSPGQLREDRGQAALSVHVQSVTAVDR